MAIVAGYNGAVSSWTNHTQLIATGAEPASFTLDLEGQEFDTTTFASAGTSAFLKGLTGWRGSITHQLKTPATGDAGLVTFSAGYVANLTNWELTFNVAEILVTAFGATSQAYIQGLTSWDGSFGGYMDDTTAVTAVSNSSEPATATFKVREAGATDDTLSGSIFTKGANLSVSPNEANAISYQFRGSGALTQSTPSAGTTIFPTGAVTRISPGTLTLLATTGDSFSGTAFLTRSQIRVAVNELITVTHDFRGAGALTITNA